MVKERLIRMKWCAILFITKIRYSFCAGKLCKTCHTQRSKQSKQISQTFLLRNVFVVELKKYWVFFYFYKSRNTSRSNWSWRGKGVFFFLGERIPILTYESFQHAASKSKISASQTIGNVAINRFKEYANHKRSTFSIIQISNLWTENCKL